MKNRNINEIIDNILLPQLPYECRKLGIPIDFIAGVYGMYPEAFGRVSCCVPILENNKIIAVNIRLDSEIRNSFIAKMHFWHELRHAQDCYENKPAREWRVHGYVLKRIISALVVTIANLISNHLSSKKVDKSRRF